ncbi:coiled-coil domain-containing protein 175 [Pelecanus crispus]|uniref:coiled-coil domain-containing protein 175 n=1 Tax=Pelecanus crispus TaxID=36300 RepID=UPI003F5D0C35
MACSSSAVAPAALSRLQSLENHLKNEDSAFSGEIIQCLEDTIAAIKKLEEIRRHTLECLEEETIKNSNLRFRMQNFPGEIIAEMTALVTAAREASAAKINQLQSALKSIADEIELLDEKKTLCERQNAALCEEQEYLRTQYKERVDLLNERMATKVKTNVLLIETCDKTRATEREIIRAKAALAELKEKAAEKMSTLEKEKEECDKKIEMKKILDTQEAKTSEKKHEFENLNIKFLDLQHLICLNSKISFFKQFFRIQLDSELLLLQSKIAQEKEDFDNELEKTKEDLRNAKCLNKKLKLENKAVRQKYEQVLEEEQYWAIKKDEIVAKNMKESYAEELASLKQDLKTEIKTRVMLQWKLLYLAKQRKLFFSEEENINRKVNERIEAGKKRHAELLLEIEDLQKEIFQSENQVKALSEEASKRENDYRNYNEDLTNKIKCLEEDVDPFEIQEEFEKKDEEVRVKRAIQQSVKTTGKLKEDTLELRNKLRIKRDAAVDQLKNHTESMKLLERDIYEINRKLDIVNIENCRFKLCNAQIKEDIFAMDSEAENHKSATVKILNDLAVLHAIYHILTVDSVVDLVLKGWSEESFIQKEFLENEQEILNAVTALRAKIQRREEKIGDINSRLQNKLEGLTSLFDKKSRMDDHQVSFVMSHRFGHCVTIVLLQNVVFICIKAERLRHTGCFEIIGPGTSEPVKWQFTEKSYQERRIRRNEIKPPVEKEESDISRRPG